MCRAQYLGIQVPKALVQLQRSLQCTSECADGVMNDTLASLSVAMIIPGVMS